MPAWATTTLILACGPLSISAGPEPALEIKASAALVEQAWSGPLEVQLPTWGTARGFVFEGEGLFRGCWRVQPVPYFDGVRLRLYLSGSGTGQSTGRRGPIQVESHDRSRVAIVQDVVFDGNGLTSLPPQIQAPTKSRIEHVDADWPPLRRAAARGVVAAALHAQPRRVNRTATELAEQVLADYLRAFADDLIPRLERYLVQVLFDPLRRAGVRPGEMHFSSTAEGIAFRVGPGPASGMTSAADLSIHVQQSFLESWFRSALAETKWTSANVEERLGRWYRPLGLTLPEASESRAWSATFDPRKPLQVQLGDDQVVLTLHIKEYAVEEDKFAGIQVRARYRLEQIDGNFRAIRPGPVEVLFADGKDKKLAASEIALRRLLERRFGRLLPPEIDLTLRRLPELLGHVPGQTYRLLARDERLLLEWRANPDPDR